MVAPAWTLGDRLRKARETAQMDQGQLADAIGVSARSVYRWEHDERQPRRPVLLSWALATNVGLEWLCGGDVCPECGESRSRCFLECQAA